jgi:hypothetical protein
MHDGHWHARQFYIYMRPQKHKPGEYAPALCGGGGWWAPMGCGYYGVLALAMAGTAAA